MSLMCASLILPTQRHRLEPASLLTVNAVKRVIRSLSVRVVPRCSMVRSTWVAEGIALKISLISLTSWAPYIPIDALRLFNFDGFKGFSNDCKLFGTI